MKSLIIPCFFVLLFPLSLFGAEFRINDRTSLDQANPAVSIAPNGNFYVVWSSRFSTSGRSNDIVGRCFDPNGLPVGEEFPVNTTTFGNQTEPSIAICSSGNFIITWHGPGLIEDAEDIYARWFDANGLPVSEEFCVNTQIEDKQRFSKVTTCDSGVTALVWECENSSEDTSSICCRLYDANGLALGGEFRVNIDPDCRYPDISMDAKGNFVVCWMHEGSANSIMARIYDANGLAKTGAFKVNTIDFSSLTKPAVAMDISGRFVIAWDGDPNLAGLDDIHARIFEPNGVAFGEQFKVNVTCENAQQNPQVAIDEFGRFAIVWDCMTDPNNNSRDIFAQRFDSFGEPIDSEFCLNSYIEDDQKYPAVAIGKDNRLVTVWQSYGQEGSSNYGIFGQICQMITADFDSDGFVNFHDYWFLAEQWYQTHNPLIADLIHDDMINEKDLAEFCNQWLLQ